jgi:NADPH-dependent 2,4-dienoyl-CoA reductase/sulfur reductase-like enzyme
MKRERRWIRLEFPTEEQVFAEFEEELLAFRTAFHAGVTIPIKDAVLVARGFFGPAVKAYLARKRLEADHFEKHNRDLSQAADQRKGPALVIADRLLKEQRSLRLARKKSQLGELVHKELKEKHGNAPPLRTIRRWVSERVDELIRQAPKK